jgi:hypothetical protein
VTDGQASEIRPAVAELLSLAVAVRGDRWANRLGAALTAAKGEGWPWPRAGAKACQLIFAPEAEPQMLADAARRPDPLAGRDASGEPPSDDYRQARAALDAAPGDAA